MMGRCYFHEWKPIPGFPGYLVSECGQVASEDRVILRSNITEVRLRGKQLKLKSLSSGHQIARLSKRSEILVHRLVLMAFVGPCPEGMEACHIDDEPSNNHISNLKWGTRSENMLDRVRNGRHHQVNKKVCKRGHEFTEENTYRFPSNSGRTCKICHLEKGKKRKKF